MMCWHRANRQNVSVFANWRCPVRALHLASLCGFIHALLSRCANTQHTPAVQPVDTLWAFHSLILHWFPKHRLLIPKVLIQWICHQLGRTPLVPFHWLVVCELLLLPSFLEPATVVWMLVCCPQSLSQQLLIVLFGCLPSILDATSCCWLCQLFCYFLLLPFDLGLGFLTPKW